MIYDAESEGPTWAGERRGGGDDRRGDERRGEERGEGREAEQEKDT